MSQLFGTDEWAGIAALLDSPDEANYELAALLLEPALDDPAHVGPLMALYRREAEREAEAQRQQALRRLMLGLGQVGLGPSRASRLLSLVFGKADPGWRDALLPHFLSDGSRRLSLPRTEWAKVPWVLWHLPGVEELLWPDGQLRSLPEAWAAAPLRVLDLRFQPIEAVPPSLLALPSLRRLHLRSAYALPPDIHLRPDLEVVVEGAY